MGVSGGCGSVCGGVHDIDVLAVQGQNPQQHASKSELFALSNDVTITMATMHGIGD